MRFYFRHVAVLTALLSVGVTIPPAAAADCYDILGCTDKDDFAKHFGDYLASVQNGPNCEFLWTMRNAIFAGHGYCFQSERSKTTFGNANCHFTDIAQVPLNTFERANVATIARAEKVKGCAQ